MSQREQHRRRRRLPYRERSLFVLTSLLAAALLARNLSYLGNLDVGGYAEGSSHSPPTDALGINATARASLLPPTPPLQGSVVMKLTGRLGNHLYHLAYYFAVRTIARSEFNLNLTLHVRKERHSKAGSAAQNAMCLKCSRGLDFDECDWWERGAAGVPKGRLCEERVNRQVSALRERFGGNGTAMGLAESLRMRGSTSDGIRSFLRAYAAMLTDDSMMGLYCDADVGWTSEERRPFLFSNDRLFANDALVDEFYGRGLKEYFAFDDDAKSRGCCSTLPEEDEHVFHYRGFTRDVVEEDLLPGGWAELAPAAAADVLSASLVPGTRIALVSARGDRVAAYVRALQARSFIACGVAGQSGIQDFCFLAHARAGLWGTARSSFVTWAGLIAPGLRNATLYGVNYPARAANITGRAATNADLARIVHYPVFNLSNEDVW